MRIAYDQSMGALGEIITVLAQAPPSRANIVISALHGALVDEDNGAYHRSILNAALKGDEDLAHAEINRFREYVRED